MPSAILALAVVADAAAKGVLPSEPIPMTKEQRQKAAASELGFLISLAFGDPRVLSVIKPEDYSRMVDSCLAEMKAD